MQRSYQCRSPLFTYANDIGTWWIGCSSSGSSRSISSDAPSSRWFRNQEHAHGSLASSLASLVHHPLAVAPVLRTKGLLVGLAQRAEREGVGEVDGLGRVVRA